MTQVDFGCIFVSETFSAGVGKLRPAGQIRPAETFCLALGVLILTLKPEYLI